MNILLVGANGKMGAKIRENCKENRIIAGVDLNENLSENIYGSFNQISQKQIKNIDIVLDFAMPSVLKKELIFCVKNKKPLVICSTGHSKGEMNLINLASKKIPIFKTGNTSLGIAFINKILIENKNLISKYDVVILDIHHKQKKDAPSGTAVNFVKNLKDVVDAKTISIREGNVVGEHSIILFSEDEQITITHKAENRDLFAKSAFAVCDFLIGKAAGIYDMQDLTNK